MFIRNFISAACILLLQSSFVSPVKVLALNSSKPRPVFGNFHDLLSKNVASSKIDQALSRNQSGILE